MLPVIYRYPLEIKIQGKGSQRLVVDAIYHVATIATITTFIFSQKGHEEVAVGTSPLTQSLVHVGCNLHQPLYSHMTGFALSLVNCIGAKIYPHLSGFLN